ncbi:hypothetical protein CBER1_05559 [Cercospora berteroae]|uniref:Uncharacterized protein n=1 Tax=Cercospora berteroae TaxID=357750 RepID=A0A2S6BSG4_9PEZI|nr:hypothetical protein CBER1_05559 [Cercospora berteroae]
MHCKNLISLAAALLLGQAAALPTQLQPQNVHQNDIAARAPTQDLYNNLAARDDQAVQEAQAEANANAKKIFDVMQQMKTNQENNIPNTMTEEQARQQYPFAFSLSDYQTSTTPQVGIAPEFYGFGSGEDENGSFQNFGYYQLSKSENGVAWKGPGFNYDLSRGSLSTDFNKMTPYVYLDPTFWK